MTKQRYIISDYISAGKRESSCILFKPFIFSKETMVDIIPKLAYRHEVLAHSMCEKGEWVAKEPSNPLDMVCRICDYHDGHSYSDVCFYMYDEPFKYSSFSGVHYPKMTIELYYVSSSVISMYLRNPIF